MKLVLPNIDRLFERCESVAYEIVIENQVLLRDVVTDLCNQTCGLEGRAVLSENDKPIPISKNLEILTTFIPFELNKKSILGKISSELDKRSSEPDLYKDTLEILSHVEKYLYDISFDLNCDLRFESISIASLIKASGIKINEDYDSLGEKIIDYFELVTEFDRRKLFILVGLRSYLDDTEMTMFVESVYKHGYSIVLIEPVERKSIDKLKRFIIDEDLCEIG